MTYDNIRSHKKPGLHPLCRRYILKMILKIQILKNNSFPSTSIVNCKLERIESKKKIIIIHVFIKVFHLSIN